MTVTILEPKQTTLYYREGSSDKIYQVSLEGTDNTDLFHVRFAYGRRCTTLQTGTKTAAPVDYDTALKTFNQLVAAKMAKGYTPGEDGTPYQHTGNEGRATGIFPQLLNPVDDEHALGSLLLDPLFCLQEKHDGFRLMLRKRGETIVAINRKGLVVAAPAAMVDAMRQVQEDFLIDGEAVGDTLHAFDLLAHAGVDYRQQPYSERLNLLTELLRFHTNGVQAVYTAWTAREKIALYNGLRQQSREGVVIKNLTAAHQPGKTSGSSDQLKYKFVESASFVVTLVHPTKRSVSLGLYSDGSEIVEAGNVTIPPNHPMPKAGVVVEVRYLYAFRESGAVYQPVYLGEREDIDPAECTVSQLKYRHEPAATIRV